MKGMKIIVLLVSTFLAGIEVFAQFKIAELSPPGRVWQRVGFTEIEVFYERPAARGRSSEYIFGTLVPMGKVWRTGAGRYTHVSFSKPVTVGGSKVSAGTYALFTIPGKDKWTIILNADTAEYAAFNYDQKKDVARVDAIASQTSRFYESLTIDIDPIPNNARIYIAWLNTQVSFDVQTGHDEEQLKYIKEKLVTGISNNPEDYESAFLYYRWHGGDREQMMKFINKGIELRDDRIWYYWKIEELMKDGKFEEARKAARHAITLIEKSTDSPERKKELIADFENYLKEMKN